VGPKFTLGGPEPPDATSGKKLTYPEVLAYTYIAVMFQLRSSTNVRLHVGYIKISGFSTNKSLYLADDTR